MTTHRLPTVGGDNGDWGTVLNDFLLQAHNGDGSLQQTAITAAGGYTKPVGGIPQSDLDSATQTAIAQAASAYVKPAGGIPSTDMTSAVQTSLTKADNAATDVSVVHLAGTETITGAKNFTGGATINGTNIVVTSDTRLASAASAVQTVNGHSGNTVTLTASDISGVAQGLTPTAVKSSAYSINAGEFVPVDASAGSVTVTLPNAPADQSRIEIKMINTSGSNTVTVNTAGSDVFNKTGGSTSGTLSLLNQALMLQYAASSHIWYVQSDDLPLAQLDGRYGSYIAGAYGDGTHDDTTVINNALTAAATSGGTVRGKPGANYLISSPLVIGSNTTLDMTGCTVTLAASAGCNMLQDSAHAAGSVTVPSTVSNYRVIGGTWNRGANGGTGNALHSMLLGGVNVTIRDLQFTSTAGKYCISLQNITDFTVSDIFLNNVASDGVHIQGPAVRGTIRNIKGTTGDDLFAITPNDYPAYSFTNAGDVTDIFVDGLVQNAGSSRAAIILGGKNGSTVLNTKRIRVRNLTGSQSGTNTQPAIIVGDDTSQSTTSGGQVDDVTIENVSVAINTTSQTLISVNGNSSSLTIPKLTIAGISVLGDCSSVVGITGKLGTLILDRAEGSTATTAMTAVIAVGNSATWTTINRLMISHSDITFAGTRGGSLVRSSASGSVITDLFVESIFLTNASWFVDLITSTTLRCANVHATSMGGILNVRSPAVVVVAGWAGCTSDNTFSTITSTGTVESQALNFPLDITNAQVVKNNGDMCTTRATAGSISSSSPVIYDATNAHWYKVANQTTF